MHKANTNTGWRYSTNNARNSVSSRGKSSCWLETSFCVFCQSSPAADQVAEDCKCPPCFRLIFLKKSRYTSDQWGLILSQGWLALNLLVTLINKTTLMFYNLCSHSEVLLRDMIPPAESQLFPRCLAPKLNYPVILARQECEHQLLSSLSVRSLLEKGLHYIHIKAIVIRPV